MPDWEQLTFYSLMTENSNLAAVFEDAIKTVVKREPRPVVEARFYPYAGLSSTIRLRNGRIYARVSDILQQSPAEVLFSLACILVAKLYRLQAPREHERIYKQFATTPSVLDATEAARRSRGYKLMGSARGKLFDLDVIFSQLNDRYFGGKLAKPMLSWSQRRTGRVLGHHDHVHGAIVISRTLDSPKTPPLVLEYVLYHEMLHVKYPPRVVGGRTVYHGRHFRSEERRFEGFEQALALLEQVVRPVRREKRRSTRNPRKTSVKRGTKMRTGR
jgi:hypothetical protein